MEQDVRVWKYGVARLIAGAIVLPTCESYLHMYPL